MNKILLVDDDLATNFHNRYVLKKSIGECEIEMLDNGLKALEYIKNNDVPDFIFLDINMPVMDGIKFLEEAQKCCSEALDKVKVFVLISVDLTEDRLQRLNSIRNVEILKGKMLTEEYINSIYVKT